MKTVRIVDIGRGPQIEGHRLTVLDVFYYLHRGYDFAFIHRAMPSLTRVEFDAVVEYVKHHRHELVEKDRRADEFIKQGIAEQKAKGLHCDIDESLPDSRKTPHIRLANETPSAIRESGSPNWTRWI